MTAITDAQTHAIDDLALAARILRLDELGYTFGADRAERPGFVLFTARPDADPSSNRAILGPLDETTADAALQEIVRHYAARGATPRVSLTPLSRPADWPQRLLRAGFVETDDQEVFLTLPTTVTISAVPAVAVARVATESEADTAVAVQLAGFGGPPDTHAAAQRYARAHVALSDQPNGLRYYLARLDGDPAGAATARFGPDLTGVYGVATHPAARRRGVATALLGRILADARAAGHDLLFLAALPNSYADGYYRRLGFLPRFTTRTFERP